MSRTFLTFTSIGLLLTAALVACNDKDAAPAPPSAAVQGEVTPANAVTLVALSSTTLPITTILRTPSATGAYRFDSLTAGTYWVSFMPASGHDTPPAQALTVAPGSTGTATQAIAAASYYLWGDSATASYRINNQNNVTSSVQASLSGNSLQLVIRPSVNPTGQVLTLQTRDFTGHIGTYYSDNAYNYFNLTYGESLSPSATLWSTNGLEPSSLVITAVDAASRRVSGTFSATVSSTLPSSGAGRTIVGAFTDVPY